MNRIKIAILLPNPLAHDYRVIKVVSTLSRKYEVDIFHVDDNSKIEGIFNENVKCFPIQFSQSLKRKILQHSLFCYEFNNFVHVVLSKKKNYDFILANDLPSLYPAYEIAKKLNAKLIYDSHEIFLETINQFFPIKAKGGKRVLFRMLISIMKMHGSKIEKKISNKCFKMFTVNHSISHYFEKKYRLTDVGVIMNLPRKTEVDESDDYRKKYKWKEKDKIFLYQGYLNEGRGLRLLLSAMNKSPEQYKLVIIGKGVLKGSLMNLVSEYNLTNRVKFIDFVNLEDLPRYTAGADYGINLLEDLNLSKKMASPNKLFEYIHAEIPVLCSNTLENKKVLDNFNVGLLVKNTPQNILKGMDKLVDEFSIDTEVITAAKEYFCWERQEENLMHFFES